MVAVTVREKTLNVSNFAKAKQFYANICKNFLKQFFCKQKPRKPSNCLMKKFLSMILILKDYDRG